MGFLNKFLRQFSGPPPSKSNPDERLDDDLRRLLKRLPNSTKRHLLNDLSSPDGGGSTRTVSTAAPRGMNDRRASEPQFAVISEGAPLEDTEKEVTAKDYAESLIQVEDLPELKKVKALHKALKRADEEWISSFRDNGGMAGIYKAMAELAQSREDYLDDDGDDNNVHEVPEDEVKLEEELVHCVMILLNKPQGLMTLEASSDLLPLLAGSAIDSSSNYVRCNLLKLLTIMAESGPSGFETVTNALDHVKVDKDEDLRFSLLVEAFGDADSSGVALVTDLIVFFNTILSSAFEFEGRVLLRTEMIAAGILEAMQRIRDYFHLSKDDDASEVTDDEWEGEGGRTSRRGSASSDSSLSTLVMDAALSSEIDDLAAQLDLFDTVMLEDRKDAISTGMAVAEGSSGGGFAEGDEDGAGENNGAPAQQQQQELPIDPPAVASIRSVMDKLRDREQTRVVVEVTAANMDRMVDIKCGDKQWRKLRDASSSALDVAFMESDSDSDDDGGGAFGGKPSAAAPKAAAAAAAVAAVPPPAFRSDASSSRAPPALPPRTGPLPPPPPLPNVGLPLGKIPPPPPLPTALTGGAAPAAPSMGGGGGGTVAAKDHPDYQKYFKMLKMGLPEGAVLQKMGAEGVDQSILDNPDKLVPLAGGGGPAVGGGGLPVPPPPPLPMAPRGLIPPAPPIGSAGGGTVAAKDHPDYQKYFKMLKMGLPQGAVLQKMGAEGVDQAILDTPDKLVPLAGGGGGGGAGVPPPPPLPMPLRGGPPMPPPLPMPNQMGMRGAPPMPRPLAPPPKLAPKPKGPKRRPVHWDKINPGNLERTVFGEIDPSSVNLPTQLLADAFAEKPKEKKVVDKDSKEKEAAAAAAAAKKKASQKVELLDAKTLRNTGIAFKRFRMKPHDLRDSLVAMEIEKFDTDKFIALRNIAPTADDLPTLKGYEGDLDKLDEVSLFMVLTAKIPRYTSRLDCALFMKGFSNDAEFLTEKLGLVSLAVLEVVDSPRLKRLIEVVLAMGNYLNEGTRNGEAKAIKLASMLKLNTVKTMDKKKTLLHVLMGWAKENEPELVLLDEDLEHSAEASHWSLTDLKQQVNQLTKGFNLMEAQLKMAKGGVTKLEGDRFAEVVEPFLGKAKGQMDSLELEYGRVQEDYDSAAKRFGEDPTKCPSGEFFNLVSALLDMIAVAVRENEQQLKAEERRKKREAQEKKRREVKAKKELEAKELLEREEASRPMPGGGGRGPGGRGLGGRGPGGSGLMSSRVSVRPSNREGFSGRGLGGQPKPLGIDVNEGLLKRRALLSAGPESDDDSDSDNEWDEQGAIQDEYDRIKTQRVNEAMMFRQISKLKDASKREIARGQLPYQKSTMGIGGRQQSMARQYSGVNNSPAMMRQVSAVRQASNLRAMAAIRQASVVGMGPGGAGGGRMGLGGRRASGLAMGGRMVSGLGPSGAGGGMGRPGLSAGRLGGGGPPGPSRRDMSPDYGRKVAALDPRKQFKTLKSTAFLG